MGGPIQQEVEIGTDSSPPYQASLEVNTLNIGENGITAVAEDMAGNRGVESISIYRAAEPGRLRVIKALSMPTTSLFVGENVTVFFTVKNVGGSPLHLEELTAAVRRGSKWNGAQADFPLVSNITLQPNEEYVYQQSQNFKTAGEYFAEPVVKMNGKWGGIENANRVSFVVYGELLVEVKPIPSQYKVLGISQGPPLLEGIRNDFYFTKDLSEGMTDQDVFKLQRFLNLLGFTVSKQPETEYFGPLTKDAVIRFQKKHGVKGTGVVEATTRAKLNDLLIDERARLSPGDYEDDLDEHDADKERAGEDSFNSLEDFLKVLELLETPTPAGIGGKGIVVVAKAAKGSPVVKSILKVWYKSQNTTLRLQFLIRGKVLTDGTIDGLARIGRRINHSPAEIPWFKRGLETQRKVLNDIGYEKLSCIECPIANTPRSVDAIANTNMKIAGRAVNTGDLIEIKDYADSSVWKGIRSKRLTEQIKAYAGAAPDGNKVVLIFKTTIDPKHIDQLKRILGREGVTNIDIINGM